MASGRVLIADDEDSIRFVLREILEAQAMDVVEASDGESALEVLSSQDFDMAFLDIRMPGLSGLEVLERVRSAGGTFPIVVITAQNTFENAVEAMKRGAFDYLVKPFGMDEVSLLVGKVLRARDLNNEVRSLRREVSEKSGERIVGRSPALLEVFKTIGRVARSDVSVLVTGESGTGKELVARAIHAAGERHDRPFVAINAAAIPSELLESELFGHERGAFTGAVDRREGRFREASGGTLFLDEIGDMPLELQAKLLRVLQSGEVTPVGGKMAAHVDVRIIAATHRDLDAAVRDGSFREDLLYRLRVVPIGLPPLRQRREDIENLANYFVTRYGAEFSSREKHLSDESIAFLRELPWPGNVRELENAIKRAVVLASTDVLAPDDFAFLTNEREPAQAATLEALVTEETERALRDEHPEDIYRELLSRVEKPMIECALARTEGNQIQAAALLGINRNTLRKKILALGIDRSDAS